MTGIYHYRQYLKGELIPAKCLVEIITNDKKTYKVRLLQYCGNKPPQTIIRVRKKNISF
jgi:hypothetical protein